MTVRLLLASIFCCMTFTASAQDSWTIDAGKSIDKITATGRVQWRKPRPLIFGAGVAIQPAAFETYYGNSHANYSINHKSAYAYLAPMLGLSIGRRRFFQFNIIPALGVRLYAKNKVEEYSNNPATGTDRHLFYTVPSPIFTGRISFELQEQVPVHRNWRISLSEAIDLPFAGILYFDPVGEHIKFTSYSLRIGIRHIRHYPKPEERTE